MNEVIDPRQLMALKALAQTRSFTQAAKQLYLTQSAVSHSIKALEENVGVRLVERFGKKIYLTDAGMRLLEHIDNIFAEMKLARESVRESDDIERSRIRIGASTTACQYILPSVLREFKEKYPECKVIIESGDTPQALSKLSKNKIDLALTLSPKGVHECDFTPLFSDKLSVISSSSHPLASEKSVDPVMLGREKLILYSEKSYTFDMVISHFKREGLEINNPLELGSMEAIKEMVKLGIGVGILADWVVEKEIADGSLLSIPIKGTDLKRTWGISYLKGKALNIIENEFCSLCGQYGQQLERVA